MPQRELFCNICNQRFTRQLHYDNHLLTNKHKNCEKVSLELGNLTIKKKLANLEEKYEVLIKKNIELVEEVNRLKEIRSLSIINNNNKNIYNISNTININVRAFGNENWEYLENEILKIMKSVNTCIPKLVKNIHFNPDHPENHNIRILNKKENRIQIFDGKDWETRDKNDTIDSMGTNIIYHLEDNHEEGFIKKASLNQKKLWNEKKENIRNDFKTQKELRNKIECTILDNQKKLKKIQ